MAFRSQFVIGVQLTHNGIRLVEGRKTDSALLISTLRTVPYGGEEPFQVLHGVLKSLKANKIYMALPYQSVKHFFFSLPVLKKRDAQAIIERELSQVPSLDIDKNFFDFLVPHNGDGPLDYPVLTAQKAEVLSLISECQRANKRLAFMTSYPLSMQNVLRSFVPEFEEIIYANLHVEEEGGFLSIFKKGTLTFTRSFSLRPKASSGEPGKTLALGLSPVLNRIVQETSRSLLFFKQHSHGLMVKGIVVSGNIEESEALKSTMQDELGVEIHFFKSKGEGTPFSLRESSGQMLADQEAMAYAVPIGLFYATPAETANLIPKTVLKRKAIFWGRLTMLVVILTLLAGTLFTHLMLKKQAAILHDAVISQETTRREMLPIIATIKKIKGNRDRYQRLRHFSNTVFRPPIFWTPFWKDISQIIPDQMVIDQAEFTQDHRHKHTYLFTFTGEINTNSAKTTQGIYQKFISLLFSSPCVIKGNFSPPEILPAKVQIRGSTLGNHDELGSLKSKIEEIRHKGASMTFHLRGTLQTDCTGGGSK